MEVKKTERASLENNKNMFTLLGLAITLSLVWAAFEYKTYDTKKVEAQQTVMLADDEDLVLQTQRTEAPPPPPPPQQTTVIQIVENNITVDNLDINAETNDNEEVEDAPAPQAEEQKEEKEEEIFVFVEDQPGFPGGDEARLKYLRDNIKYPQMARESNTQGTVYVTFVVEKDGSITHVKVLRGIGGGCDEEAVRVIKGFPKWSPGKQRGQAVRAQFNMPIKFTLEG